MVARPKQASCLVALASLAALAACGGGGGGGGDDDGGSPPPAPGGSSVPASPPAAPVLNYTGAAGPAVLDDVSVPRLADAIYFGIELTLQLLDESEGLTLGAPGEIDETVSGPEGGSARLLGRIEDDGTGWIQTDFTNYGDQGIRWNGRQVFIESQLSDGEQGSLSEVRAIQLNAISQGRNTTLNGSILHREAPPLEGISNVSASILLVDNLRQTQVFADDIDLLRDESSGDFTVDGTARIYDEDYGYTTIEFTEPLGVAEDTRIPHHGGPLVASAANGALLQIAVLTPSIAALQYSSGANGLVDRSVRLGWSTPFATQVTGTPFGDPIADGGASLYAVPGTTVTADGSFSDHPQTGFIDFDWQLLFRPPGSAAVIDSPSAVRPEITLDVPGRYLLALEVGDGNRSARDLIVLTADEGVSPDPSLVQAQLPPDTSAELGEIVEIDKRLMTLPDFSARTSNFYVSVHGGDGSTVVSQTAETASFSADRHGTYVAVLNEGPIAQYPNRVRDFQSIHVGTERIFLPAVDFPIPDDTGDIALGDLNADSVDDLLLSVATGTQSGQIWIYYATGDGSFEPPVVLEGGQGGTVLIGDLTSDGRPDILAGRFGGITHFVQQSDGSFAAAIDTAGICLFGPEDRPMLIADVNNDGRNDVVADGTCRSTFEIFPQQADGTLGGSEPVVMSAFTADPALAAGDLNGDSITDLVTAIEDAHDVNNVAVHYGNADGTLTAPAYLPLAGFYNYSPALAVRDLNDDGRDDLLISTSEGLGLPQAVLHVYHQAADGSLDEIPNGSFPEVRDFHFLDVDRDGLLDILHGPGLTVSYQDADGRFNDRPRFRHVQYYKDGAGGGAHALGDVNGDGRLDVAFFDTRKVGFLLGIE